MFVKAIETSAVPQGEMRSVALGDLPRIAIYHVDDSFHATADRCSHARALLTRGWLEGHEIVCPVHEARFDIQTGKPLCFPATEPIPVYPVKLEDGFVWVDVGVTES
jgi:nitrite reductase/ring-hydroxylating ferredoxin subunit